MTFGLGMLAGACGVLLAQCLWAWLLWLDKHTAGERLAPQDSPAGQCQARYLGDDLVRCELPAGHAGDHHGENAHLSVQWPAG
jgi:hypothetical protein